MPDPGEALETLAASLARARGDNFFPALAAHLGEVLGAGEAMVCEAAANRRARTLAVWRAGAPAPNYEFDLEGTPCAKVQAGQSLTVELTAASFPGAPQKQGGYFGMPLAANDGAVLGHLCAYSEHVPSLTPIQRAICDILANRAAAELRLVHVKRERALLRGQRRQLRAEVAAAHDIDGMIGVSPAHVRVMNDIRRAAMAAANVLVRGEPGTGKELVARAIHADGARAAKPFVKIDCAAMSIDSDLNALPQTLALAVGGTLFLDEVGALSPDMQARLFAALPTSHGEPGSAASVNVRIIASTNRDLFRKVRDGEFREALYDRLTMIGIDLPPLRARVDDIPLLIQDVVRKCARKMGRRIQSVDSQSLSELSNYSWPGNIRELENLVERALVMQDAPVLKITTDFLGTTAPAERAALVAAAGDPAATARTALAGPVDFDDTLSTGLHVVQRDHILRVLNATHWVIEGSHGAALKLGLKPATLRHRMKKLGISRAANAGAAAAGNLPGSEIR
ncbi:MAG TPA: sigma 54-interacting transcriptional regulator [Steroidobacteraceae bacterium]|nr:sigma 54-interacting transcriptional regulator [Steroidobacteraceae bacterium]